MDGDHRDHGAWPPWWTPRSLCGDIDRAGVFLPPSLRHGGSAGTGGAARLAGLSSINRETWNPPARPPHAGGAHWHPWARRGAHGERGPPGRRVTPPQQRLGNVWRVGSSRHRGGDPAARLSISPDFTPGAASPRNYSLRYVSSPPAAEPDLSTPRHQEHPWTTC